MFAPPGSGYAGPDEDEWTLPDTYQPLMEYPGTMRPGRTPENIPFSDLPIADDDPDPVPWPHFQQIEWHHHWEPPHPHPGDMEDFIELNGRWATPEMEAQMQAGIRQGVRERQEKQATQQRDAWVITDDEEDNKDLPIELGEGMFGRLGSSAEEAITAEAVRPKALDEVIEEEEDDDTSMEDDLDSFLFDLGLDAEVDLDLEDISTKKPFALAAPDDLDLEGPDDDEDDGPSTLDLLSDSGDITATINVDADDDDMELGLDEEDADDGGSEVPLDDFEDDNDILAGEDIFDDGGFDYDEGDFDAGDVW
jgi:hypothetical protein